MFASQREQGSQHPDIIIEFKNIFEDNCEEYSIINSPTMTTQQKESPTMTTQHKESPTISFIENTELISTPTRDSKDEVSRILIQWLPYSVDDLH